MRGLRLCKALEHSSFNFFYSRIKNFNEPSIAELFSVPTALKSLLHELSWKVSLSIRIQRAPHSKGISQNRKRTMRIDWRSQGLSKLWQVFYNFDSDPGRLPPTHIAGRVTEAGINILSHTKVGEWKEMEAHRYRKAKCFSRRMCESTDRYRRFPFNSDPLEALSRRRRRGKNRLSISGSTFLPNRKV